MNGRTMRTRSWLEANGPDLIGAAAIAWLVYLVVRLVGLWWLS